jgi:hypothetical protein
MQPVRYRSDQNMAQILSKRRQQSSSKSFILRVYDVLMRDNVRSIGPGCAGMITCYTDVSPPKSQFRDTASRHVFIDLNSR